LDKVDLIQGEDDLQPEAVIWASISKKTEVASICKWPHSSSPTTVLPVAVSYLACRASRGILVILEALHLLGLLHHGKQQPPHQLDDALL
jgi:hypothetical protein